MRYRGVFVKETSFQRLMELKGLIGAKTWDELINMLVDLAMEKIKKDVRKVLCNKLEKARGSAVAWIRIFKRHNIDPSIGFEFLKPVGEDMYVIDREKCIE